MLEVSPNDRVLLLATLPVDEIRSLAAKLTGGMIVVQTPDDALYEARRNLREYDNVMVTPAEGNGAIPWKDDVFSVVYAPNAMEPSAEMLRVLEPGGTVWVSKGPVTKR